MLPEDAAISVPCVREGVVVSFVHLMFMPGVAVNAIVLVFKSLLVMLYITAS
jgi:hypothetical protein